MLAVPIPPTDTDRLQEGSSNLYHTPERAAAAADVVLSTWAGSANLTTVGTITTSSATTNAPVNAVAVKSVSTGTYADGFGARQKYSIGDTTDTAGTTLGYAGFVRRTETDGSVVGDYLVYNHAGSVTRVLTADGYSAYGVNLTAATANTGPISGLTITTAGSGYTDGTYTGVALTNVTAGGAGAYANFTVAGGAVTAAAISHGGRTYQDGHTVTATIAGGSGLVLTISSVDVAQVNANSQTGGTYRCKLADTTVVADQFIGGMDWHLVDSTAKADGGLAGSSASRHAAFHVDRGREFLARGLHADAEREFREAMQRDRNNAGAHAGLARILEARKDAPGARTQAEAALRLAPNVDAFLVLARLDMEENNLARATQTVDRALALEPGNLVAQALKRSIGDRLAEQMQSSPQR